MVASPYKTHKIWIHCIYKYKILQICFMNNFKVVAVLGIVMVVAVVLVVVVVLGCNGCSGSTRL